MPGPCPRLHQNRECGSTPGNRTADPVHRRREPQADRPYRVLGYPVVPAVFILASAALLYYTFTDNLANSAAGCLVILAGVPVFYYFARRRASTLK